MQIIWHILEHIVPCYRQRSIMHDAWNFYRLQPKIKFTLERETSNPNSTIGYAIPGAALAIGLIISFGAMNEIIIPLSDHFSLSAQSFFLSGGVVALFFAYTIRFLAISVGSVESGLEKITPNMDMASRTLGSGPFSTLCRIHILF